MNFQDLTLILHMKIAASSPKLLLTLILFFSIPNFTIAKDDLVAHEVYQLIEFIKISNCRFNRNGRWYESTEAADHLNKKYQYVQKKGLANTAEDFIKFAATKSSISGKEYVVQCEGDTTHSAEWLTTALVQIRELP